MLHKNVLFKYMLNICSTKVLIELLAFSIIYEANRYSITIWVRQYDAYGLFNFEYLYKMYTKNTALRIIRTMFKDNR